MRGKRFIERISLCAARMPFASHERAPARRCYDLLFHYAPYVAAATTPSMRAASLMPRCMPLIFPPLFFFFFFFFFLRHTAYVCRHADFAFSLMLRIGMLIGVLQFESCDADSGYLCLIPDAYHIMTLIALFYFFCLHFRFAFYFFFFFFAIICAPPYAMMPQRCRQHAAPLHCRRLMPPARCRLMREAQRGSKAYTQQCAPAKICRRVEAFSTRLMRADFTRADGERVRCAPPRDKEKARVRLGRRKSALSVARVRKRARVPVRARRSRARYRRAAREMQCSDER